MRTCVLRQKSSEALHINIATAIASPHFPTQVQTKHIMFKVLSAAAVLALAAASPLPDHPAPYHPAPAPYHEDPILPPVYNYEYGVQDSYSGAAFSQKESRDNYDTAGEYRVNLPDGRVQIVSYKADANGYVADVRYEGEASYPEDKGYKPAAHPAPAYKPAPKPAYKPAPAPAYKPAPKVYHPAPAPAYKPHPAPYHPAPAYHAAPAYKAHPAPYHAAPVYHPAPAYKPRTYSFKPVTEAPVEKAAEEAAPAAEEAAEEAAPAVEEAAEE